MCWPSARPTVATKVTFAQKKTCGVSRENRNSMAATASGPCAQCRGPAHETAAVPRCNYEFSQTSVMARKETRIAVAKSKADSRWGRVFRPASATVLGATGLDQMKRPKEPVAKIPAENTLEIIGSGLVGRCCVACGPSSGDDIPRALQKTTPVQEAALSIPGLLATAGLATVEAETPFFESVCTLRENWSDSLAMHPTCAKRGVWAGSSERRSLENRRVCWSARLQNHLILS
ncbi:unnamed protein product [Effrenium voratum]|nr:unnamed protein product [Effrenium voratum]